VISTVFIRSPMNVTSAVRLVSLCVQLTSGDVGFLLLLVIIKIVSSIKYVIQLHFMKKLSKLYFLKVKVRHERSPCSPCMCVFTPFKFWNYWPDLSKLYVNICHGGHHTALQSVTSAWANTNLKREWRQCCLMYGSQWWMVIDLWNVHKFH
jgi:hypothetical protein